MNKATSVAGSVMSNGANIYRLDGHQIIARKYKFGYSFYIEKQRRWIALTVDLIAFLGDQGLVDQRTLQVVLNFKKKAPIM